MRLRLLFFLILASLIAVSGCSLRTIPPLKYLPLLGKEKDITTTSVLIHALKDRDLSVRAQAIVLLGVLAMQDDKGIKKEVTRLLGTALKDRDPGIRLQAVEELGRIEGEYTNKYLLAALKDPNAFVREKVMDVLATREERQMKALMEAQMETSMESTPPEQ
jgi:HEAT repeat protein